MRSAASRTAAHSSRSRGLAGSRAPDDVLDDEARVAARLDPVEPGAAACSSPASSARYSATFAPATPIASPCAASWVPSAADEHVADRRRAGVAARAAVGRQDREPGPRRARRLARSAAARLGEGAALGVAVGAPAAARGAAALGARAQIRRSSAVSSPPASPVLTVPQRLDQQHVRLLVRARAVLDAARDDEQLAGASTTSRGRAAGSSAGRRARGRSRRCRRACARRTRRGP